MSAAAMILPSTLVTSDLLVNVLRCCFQALSCYLSVAGNRGRHQRVQGCSYIHWSIVWLNEWSGKNENKQLTSFLDGSHLITSSARDGVIRVLKFWPLAVRLFCWWGSNTAGITWCVAAQQTLPELLATLVEKGVWSSWELKWPFGKCLSFSSTWISSA